MPPHTTKRTTKNLKSKYKQNCQKIKLYGNPTTKELKKKHSSRLVGGAETGSWAERTRSKMAAGGLGKVVDCGTRQARLQLVDPATDCATQGSSTGEIKPQTSD